MRGPQERGTPGVSRDSSPCLSPQLGAPRAQRHSPPSPSLHRVDTYSNTSQTIKVYSIGWHLCLGSFSLGCATTSCIQCRTRRRAQDGVCCWRRRCCILLRDNGWSQGAPAASHPAQGLVCYPPPPPGLVQGEDPKDPVPPRLRRATSAGVAAALCFPPWPRARWPHQASPGSAPVGLRPSPTPHWSIAPQAMLPHLSQQGGEATGSPRLTPGLDPAQQWGL